MDFGQCGVSALTPILFKGKLYFNTYCYHYCCSLKILLVWFIFFLWPDSYFAESFKISVCNSLSIFRVVNFQRYYIVITLLPVLFLFSGIYRFNVKAFMIIQMSYVKPDINSFCKICNIILLLLLNFCFGKYNLFP